MKGSRKHISLILAIALAVAVIDQGVKRLVVGALPLNESHPLIAGILDLRYCQNTGAAFSILRDIPAPAMIAVNLLVLAVFFSLLLGVILPQLHARSSMIAAALVLGGAVGNLIDRIRLRYVIDYLDVHVWPVFNIADMAIVIGVGLLVLTVLASSHSAPSSPGGDRL